MGTDKQWKRTILRKADDFIVKDGQLYAVGKKGQGDRCRVYDEEDQRRVMETCHNNKLGKHHPSCLITFID